MDRTARLSSQLTALESEYRNLLTKALTDCAEGRWGLFGHNEHLRPSLAPELDELRDLAAAIDRLRARTGAAPFELHREFEAARGRAGPNYPGEPKQAQAWLKRLADL